MAQNVLYSTIVMVYFKQKNRTCKSDPHNSGKLRIESYIKLGIGEQLFQFRAHFLTFSTRLQEIFAVFIEFDRSSSKFATVGSRILN